MLEFQLKLLESHKQLNIIKSGFFGGFSSQQIIEFHIRMEVAMVMCKCSSVGYNVTNMTKVLHT